MSTQGSEEVVVSQEAPETGSQSTQFVSRVSNLPVVNTALDYTASGYERIKETHEIINYTLTQVENSIKYTAEQAKPAIQKLEKPIQLADQMACNGLDKLEEKLPIIHKPPEEIVDDTKKMCASTVQAGLSTYQGMKKLGSDKLTALSNYGASKAHDILQSSYGQFVVNSADNAIKVTEQYVDYLLPPTEGETEEQTDTNLVGRVENLSKKTKDRLYKKATEQVDSVRKRSQEALQNMKNSLDLIQYAKSLDPRIGFSEAVTAMQDKASWLWEELNKDETPEEATAEKTLEKKVLFVARRATKQLVQAYTTYVATLQNAVPQSMQERLIHGKEYAVEMYNLFHGMRSLSDISTLVMKQTRERLTYLQETLTSLVNSVIMRTDSLKFWTKAKEEAESQERKVDEENKSN